MRRGTFHTVYVACLILTSSHADVMLCLRTLIKWNPRPLIGVIVKPSSFKLLAWIHCLDLLESLRHPHENVAGFCKRKLLFNNPSFQHRFPECQSCAVVKNDYLPPGRFSALNGKYSHPVFFPSISGFHSSASSDQMSALLCITLHCEV
jgi:hypothetical protein